MKFLIENAISPGLSSHLKKIGHNCVQVRDYGLASATDAVIFDSTSGNRLLEFDLLSSSRLRSEICEVLQRGLIAVIEPKRIRTGALPIGGDAE